MLSLKSRVFTSHNLQAPAKPRGGRFRTSRETEERLHKAYESVKNDEMTLRQASEVYEVAKSTLHDRITGKVLFGSHSGPRRFLSEKEEEELVVFLMHCATIGYPRSRKDVMNIVQATLVQKGHHHTLSYSWWDSFRKRHPDLSLRKAEVLSHPRYVCCTSDTINRYFDLLEEALDNNGLRHLPCQIFNCDESGFSLDPPAPNVIVPRGTKHPYNVSSGDKSQITALVCSNAGGYVIPPFIIFDRKNLKPEMTEGEVPGSMYGLSNKGWIDRELFNLWFNHHFLAYAPPARPLLLLLDGHSSHYSPDVVDKAASEGVVMFCLPPHSSHLTQPLDRVCFSVLKKCWQEECFSYRLHNPCKGITRYNFSEVFHKAWVRAMTMPNITKSFEVSGVYPVDRSRILPSIPSMPSSKLDKFKKSGVSFIPLYSPGPKQKPNKSNNFTHEELVKFERRYNEGYDIKTDTRYNLWLDEYHPSPTAVEPDSDLPSPISSSLYSPTSSLCSPAPTSSPICSPAHRESTSSLEHSTDDCYSPKVLSSVTVMKKVLDQHQPKTKIPAKEPKTSARVLTSDEHRRILNEKQEIKRQEEERKAQKKAERGECMKIYLLT